MLEVGYCKALCLVRALKPRVPYYLFYISMLGIMINAKACTVRSTPESDDAAFILWHTLTARPESN